MQRLVALACPFLVGCTLLGGAVGSSVPAYQPLGAGTAATAQIRPGDRIEVARVGDPWRLEGIYDGVEDDALRLFTDEGRVSIDLKDISSVSVTHGSEWFTGMLVGLGVDLAILAIAGSRAGDAAPGTGAVGAVHAGSGGTVIGGRP